MKIKNIVMLLFFILLSQMAGFIGSVFTAPAIDSWYAGINKPSFTPPDWIFAPVWLLLYLLIGISAYLVWRRGINKRKVRIALIIFTIQLVLNASWSILFFGFKAVLPAFIEIVVLWLAILVMVLRFWSVSKNAGLLLLPYLLWVSFAAVLNLSIALLN